MAPRGECAYEFGPFLLIAADRALLHQGQRVPLTPKAFETLLTLVENAGHVVTKETLIKRVWPDTNVQEDSLTFNISTLRKVLGDHNSGQQFIQTEHKLGYRFVAPVKVLAPASADPASLPNLSSDVISLSPGIATPSPSGRAGVRDKWFGLPARSKWLALGLLILTVVATTVWLATPPPEPKIVKYDQLTNDGREKHEDLATDGERVYFIEQAPTGWVIAQVSAFGGEPVPIASTPMDSEIADISPDHQDLLVVERKHFEPGTLKLVPLLAGEPRRLGNVRAHSASWSPDGATLAYTSEGGVYLCDPAGSNSRQIVSMSGQLVRLHWSPDGRRLSFTRRSDPSGNSLWEVGRNGDGLRCLYPGLLSGFQRASGPWTPNGEYLITDSNCAGHATPSAVRLSSGPFGRHWGQPACLGSGPLELGDVAVSPDGNRLFGWGNPPKHTWMEEYDTRTRDFRPFLPHIPANYADFSGDGQRIAYVTGQNDLTGPHCLWISQVDGSHKAQITKPPLIAQLPRWSPDGRWVAFMGKDPGQPWRVRVVSVGGGPYEPVTTVNDQEGAPTWSPDSAQLVFGGMTQPQERTAGKLVIHVFNLATRQLSILPGSEGLWTARWSPDGRYVAALTKDSRNLMLFDFRTSRWVKLATLAQIPDLVWSRHEEALYFNGEPASGERSVFRVKIPGGQVERLTSLNGRNDFDWLGLTADDCPLIARIMGAREVYALAVNWP